MTDAGGRRPPWPLWLAAALAVAADAWTVLHLRAGHPVVETGLHVPLKGPSVLAAAALLLLAYHAAEANLPRALAWAAAAYGALGAASVVIMGAVALLGGGGHPALWLLVYPPVGWLVAALNWPVVLTAVVLCPLGVVPC